MITLPLWASGAFSRFQMPPHLGSEIAGAGGRLRSMSGDEEAGPGEAGP